MQGTAGLADAGSRPKHTRNSIDERLSERIEHLRRSGLSSLKALDPSPPVLRYEHLVPGELLHMDTKKLGRIVAPGDRITGDRRDHARGVGWEVAHVAIDDHSRVGFVQVHPD